MASSPQQAPAPFTDPILEVVADGRPGGGTTAVLGLCEDLHRGGHRVTMITDVDSYAAQEGARLGIETLTLPFFRSRFDPRIALGLRRHLAALDPGIVHAHGARAALPLSFAGRGRARTVYTVHGYHFIGKSGPARSLAKLAETRIAGRVDAGVFVSYADRDIARGSGIAFARTEVIYNGIDLGELTTGGDKTFDLVFSARMHRQKNPLFLVALMQRLAPAGVRLLVVGGGELEAGLRQRMTAAGLDDAVSFTGALPRSEALVAIRSARLFVMPSLWEGLPIAPIEALASGVPVVGSDIAGTREVVSSGETGVLVPGFDADDWAKAIRALLADPARIATLARNGVADAHRRFTREQSSGGYLALYRSLLGLPAAGL